MTSGQYIKTLKHRENIAKYMTGRCREKSPHWKGGKILQRGYIKIRVGKTYIFEHRLMMEESIGRHLKQEEKIHHLNGIKTDNRIDNLIIVTNEAHPHYHRDIPPILCLNCKIVVKYPKKNQIYCSKICNYAHRWNKSILDYLPHPNV